MLYFFKILFRVKGKSLKTFSVIVYINSVVLKLQLEGGGSASMRPCINFAAARSGVFCIYGGGGVLASTPAMRCSKHPRIRFSELVAAFGTLYAVCLSAALQLYETATMFSAAEEVLQ